MPAKRLHRSNVFLLTLIHLVALAAIPFFTWSALAICLLLLFTISPIGVTMTYHRLLSHRAFKVPRWLEYTLTVFGALSAQGSVLIWVATHRHHHRYSDTEKDLHSSRKGFWWSHVGHLLYHNDFAENEDQWGKYVPDLAKQPFYRWISKYSMLIAVSIVPLLYWAGGISWVLWGGFVRVVLMLHITWFVNSATHKFGYRNFDTRDASSNCWWVGLLAAGEGWHNNHHAEPRCAAHGRLWWEFDLTYLLIRGLGALGLATEIKWPGPIPARKAAKQLAPSPLEFEDAVPAPAEI